jgi:anti-sigma factor RsiW
MNEINDRLEILIGRLVDGEISPSERRILERELETNSQARELLEQLRDLRQQSCRAVAAEVSGGASADAIFERAWQQNAKSSYRRVFRIDGRLRFAIGLAAGLIFGLALHFVAVWGSRAPMQAPGQSQLVASETPREIGGQTMAPQMVKQEVSPPVTRQVDWFVFTSPTGEQWLVEGVREGLVKTADYRGKPRPM